MPKPIDLPARVYRAEAEERGAWVRRNVETWLATGQLRSGQPLLVAELMDHLSIDEGTLRAQLGLLVDRGLQLSRDRQNYVARPRQLRAVPEPMVTERMRGFLELAARNPARIGERHGLESFARRLGYSETTVQTSLQPLVEAGMVTFDKKTREIVIGPQPTLQL